jgi:hypothetical protein
VILGSRLGFAAVNALIAGETQKMVRLEANHIKLTSLKRRLSHHEFKLEADLLQMVEVLSILMIAVVYSGSNHADWRWPIKEELLPLLKPMASILILLMRKHITATP